jgi:uncharacterized membrane protein
MQDKDSLIEKLAAANKLRAAGVTTPVSSPAISSQNSKLASNHAPAPPAFLTKEGAASLFGLSSQSVEVPHTKEPLKPTTVVPAPTHDELLAEIQKLELLSDKKEVPEPVTVMATSAETNAANLPKVAQIKPSWRSWLLPLGVALAGIACVSVLPKSEQLPPVAAKPAVIQKAVVQKGEVTGAVSSPTIAKSTVEPSAVLPSMPAAMPVTAAATTVVAATPASAVVPEVITPPTVLARPNEPVAVKVTATPSTKSPALAKRQAEEAILSAKKIVPASQVAPKVNKNSTDKSQQADRKVTHNTSSNHLDLPKVPVVAVAAVPAAVLAPVISAPKAIAKGPDQCAGLSGMAADQCRQCHDFSFIRRLSCEGQIRVKYCEGREGMIRECPVQVDKRH